MKMTIAGAVIALTGAILPALDASAAPIVVKDYYEDNGAKVCESASSCIVKFSPIPAGRVVVLTRVNCTIFADNVSHIDGTLSAVQANGFLGDRAQYFIPDRVDDGENVFLLNQEVELIFGPGTRPGVQIAINTNVQMRERCQIVGRLL